MNSRTEACFIIILALALAPALAACGSNGRRSAPGGGGIPVTSLQDTSAQVAEVFATPAPEGVDVALWDMLRDELARELAAKASSQAVEELPEWNRWGLICTSRYVDGTRLVEWDSSFFKGDGSQNGVVDVADLVPIAQHFGQSVTYLSEAKYADYNDDSYINISDISALAMNFGKTCASFIVEISVTARRSGYVTSEVVSFTDWYEKRANGFAGYRHEYSPSVAKIAWIRVKANDAQGTVIAYDTTVLRYDAGKHPYFPVDDLKVVSATAGSIAWSSIFFTGDGSGDGRVSEADVSPIAMHWNKHPAEDSYATMADYDRDGIVGILDMDSLLDHLWETCTGFLVEVSTTGPTGGFVEDGSPTFIDCVKDGWNEFGSRDFEYTIQSPPDAPYWVRVTPSSDYPTLSLGLPSAAVEITP